MRPGAPTQWNSVYVWFRRWAKQGAWEALLETLLELGPTNDGQHMIDSTYSFGGNSPEGWRIRRLAWIEIWANRWSQAEPVDLLVLYLHSRPFHG